MKSEQHIREFLLKKKIPLSSVHLLLDILEEEKKSDFRKEVTQKQKTKSRPKGYSLEKKTAVALSNWWTGGKDRKYIRRVPLSGGYDKSIISGDLFCPENPLDFPISVECKNQEGWDILSFMEGKGKIVKWWKQCIDDVMECKYRREPVLVITKNYTPVYWICRSGAWANISMKLFDGMGKDYEKEVEAIRNLDRLVISNKVMDDMNRRFGDRFGSVVMIKFDDIIKTCSPKYFKVVFNIKVGE